MISNLGFNLIKLSLIPGYGNITIVSKYNQEDRFLSEKEHSFEGLIKRFQIVLKEISISELETRFDKIISDCEKKEYTVLNFTDLDYPLLLKETFSYPPVLYAKGEVSVLNKKSLAIVGSRKNSDYGSKVVEDFVSGFEGYDIAIVSGLALGIDAIAHKSALKHKVKCIGVMAHGLNFVHPTTNYRLYQEIVAEGGCLISEYPPDQNINSKLFPIRNRIVAGVSKGTLVVEASKKSGTLITAAYALEFNREVYAVPSSIYTLSSEGCNYLIKNNSAKLVTSATDIIDDLGLKGSENVSKAIDLFNTLSESQKEILEILSSGPRTVDEIQEKINLSIDEISSELTSLELEGVIASLQNKWFLNINSR